MTLLERLSCWIGWHARDTSATPAISAYGLRLIVTCARCGRRYLE